MTISKNMLDIVGVGLARFKDGTSLGGFRFGCHEVSYFKPAQAKPEAARQLWYQWARWWDPYVDSHMLRSGWMHERCVEALRWF